MLTISARTMSAFVVERARETAKRMSDMISQADPAIPARLGKAELQARVDRAVQLAIACDLKTERDILLLSMAHAIHGGDLVQQPKFEWLMPLLQERPTGHDNRIYRMHCRLSEMDVA